MDAAEKRDTARATSTEKRETAHGKAEKEERRRSGAPADDGKESLHDRLLRLQMPSWEVKTAKQAEERERKKEQHITEARMRDQKMCRMFADAARAKAAEKAAAKAAAIADAEKADACAVKERKRAEEEQAARAAREQAEKDAEEDLMQMPTEKDLKFLARIFNV